MISIVSRDLFLNLVLALLGLVVLMLPWLNPPTKDDTSRPPGNVVVELRWAPNSPADVDLWVQGPGDRPVGYSRKSGIVFDLLRDDLGSTGDLTGLNFEFAFSRGAPAGEYIVNVHLYNQKGADLPMPVTVDVSLRDPRTGALSMIASRSVELLATGDEITIVRFRLDAQGRIVPGSINHVYTPLRPAYMAAEQ